MKTVQPQRFSRDISQFIAHQINSLTKRDCKKVLKDLEKITQENQWCYLEFELRDILKSLVHRRWISLN